MTDHEESAVSQGGDGSPVRPERSACRAYEPPRLTVLGDVRTITMGPSLGGVDSGGYPAGTHGP
ncbi:MAG: lasso RiPP family leader peptide-containing protein [Acidobacteria bacterium]|nr:lasso RiPP family leader peptide-containing protein [Acidobacteriota bacterium]